MANKTIYPQGMAEITVPATESIAISNFGGGIAKIYYLIEDANQPPSYQFQQTLENSSVTLGAFSAETIVKIEANNSKVIYDVATAPDTGIGDADTLGGNGPAFYTNASNLSSGTLPDARLSANVHTTSDFVFEESTFTPVIVGTSAAGVGTYSYQVGYYQRIGNWVTFRANISWSAHTGTGNILVNGLPYTAHATRYPPVTIVAANLTYAGELVAIVEQSDTFITVFSQATGAALANVAMDTAAVLYLSGCYQVA